jgi:hypothetical protein
VPRRDQVTRTGGVEQVIARADAPELIRVRTRLVQVERHERGYGTVEHDPVPDLDLLLHVGEGLRMIRELPRDMRGRRRFEENLPTSTEAYDEIATDADLDLVVQIKGTDQTLSIITDTATTTTLARGGARSLKTHTGSYWAFRQWMLRGSPSGLGWFVGPSLDVAHVLKQKWIDGEGEGVPPICPRELVAWYPKHDKETDQHIYMIDGFRIRMMHASTKGKNMPGRSVDFVQWTESAVTENGKPFARVRGRITTSKGQIYMDAVPEPRSWLRDAITDPAIEEETELQEKAKKGDETANGREYGVHTLDSANNPWNDAEDTAAFRKALERMDPRLARREAGGEDIGDANRIFGELFDQARHTFDFEGLYIPDPMQGALVHGRPLIDITRQASKRVFRNAKEWIAAVDVNARPHTALISKIGLPPGLDATNPDHWVFVAMDGLQVFDVDSEEAAGRLAEIHGGLFKGAGVIMDATSCVEGHNAGGRRNTDKGMMPREMYERAGFEVEPPGYRISSKKRRSPENPPRFSGSILQRRLLRDNRCLFSWMRCRGLVRAIRDQLDAGDGITPEKSSNTAMDRKIAAWIETWRYTVWPLMAVQQRETRSLKLRQYA